MIETKNPKISLRRQCSLVGLSRATYYWQPAGESQQNLKLMKMIDQEYTRAPFYGSRKITVRLNQQLLEKVNRKRVVRLMRKMGLQAIYPHKKTSIPDHQHKKYPYLLRNLSITHPNQVWATDITYIPMRQGFMYLTAIMDWYSRFVITWQLSNTLDGLFCLEALKLALQQGTPKIFNTDQGAQFTAQAFTSELEAAGVLVSMDGRGRAYDNIFVERLWRTIKYEDIYIKDYASVIELQNGLEDYLWLYNYERPHQGLGYQTPAEVYGTSEESAGICVESHLKYVDSWSRK
jgi:putative transposase